MTSTTTDFGVLTQKIREKAAALGFQKVGVIPATVLEQESQRLAHWLKRDFQADMDWMATHFEKRRDPRSLMPETRSIVCVAMNYFTRDEHDPEPNGVKIAKYARGTDYHRIVKKRLKALLKEIQGLDPSIQGRAFTDSAPLMEKALANRAGLGWIGKNGNLITKEYGSWVFLGELLLSCELDYDQAFENNLCGSCRRCVDACPTDAIVEPTVIDANRCISYWTIEFKGEEIPATIAEKMEGWVFGCDICQDVCPWNIKFAQETTEERFFPRPWNRQPTSDSLLSLTPETFSQQYQQSPIKRTKLHGLLRNVRAVRENLHPR